MNVVLRFDPARLEGLRAFLVEGGHALDARPHALLFASRPGVNVTAYASGKLVVAGAQAEEYAGVLVANRLAAAPEAPGVPGDFEPHVGSDESGKGDYFGPLAVAAVHVPDRATARLLLEKGVRDSKLVGRAETGPLASLVRARCLHATVVVSPPRYNEIYDRMGNLNDLLAWGHARALEDLLEETGPLPVVVDQFARPAVLEAQLMPRGRAVPLQQVTGAERDIAVAAASILARAEFMAGMAALETRHGLHLPYGAGPPVTQAARSIAAKGGLPLLREVAKLHFAITEQVHPG